MSVTLLLVCTLLVVNAISLRRQYYNYLVLGFTTPTPKGGTNFTWQTLWSKHRVPEMSKSGWGVGGEDTDIFPLIHVHTDIGFKSIPFIARSQTCKTHAILE